MMKEQNNLFVENKFPEVAIPWEKSAFEQKLSNSLVKHGLQNLAVPPTLDTLERLACRLFTVGSFMNLTAILDEEGIILKHFVDCLTVSPYLPVGAKLVDVGCGGGFPSLPLGIARPDLDITPMDSTAKKVGFVADTARELGLSNLHPKVARAEDAAHDRELREHFDVAVARAVSALPLLSELCLPFVAQGGVMVAMKSKGAEEELEGAKGALPRLGAGKVQSVALSLCDFGMNEERTLLLIPKISPTPSQYPRPYAQMKKKPL